MEDFFYLVTLWSGLKETEHSRKSTADARRALKGCSLSSNLSLALQLPNTGGPFSSKILLLSEPGLLVGEPVCAEALAGACAV